MGGSVINATPPLGSWAMRQKALASSWRTLKQHMSASDAVDNAVIEGSQAARELLRRQRARNALVDYAVSIEIPGAPARTDAENDIFRPIETRVAHHHRVIMSAIQETMMRPNGLLMIFAPPGSAKSTYASVVSTTWAMGKWPGHRIILGSYGTTIAAKQSRKARAICKQTQYTSIWDSTPRLLDDQRAVDEWSLTNGSEFMAAGLLAGITGNRANGFVLDDVVMNREQADSSTLQDKIYEEYIDTVQTRLLPGGWTVLIQTRWNEGDLAGRILPEKYNGESGLIPCRDGQLWRVVCLPAIAERPDDPLGRAPGDPLWPEWFPPTHWDKWRLNPRAQRTWSALFQQRPAPKEGVQFSRQDFKRYELGAHPRALNYYGASDYATLNEDGDFTEHGIAGMDKDGDLWITDWWYGQKETDASIEAFITMIARTRCRRWWHEGGLIDKAIAPAIRRRMRERQKYVAMEALTSISDKEAKLMSFHARVSAKTVWIPNCPWGERLIDQLVGFPAAAHDDAADVCGLLGRGIDQMTNASEPRVESRPQLIPFTEKWLEWNDQRTKPKVRFTS